MSYIKEKSPAGNEALKNCLQQKYITKMPENKTLKTALSLLSSGFSVIPAHGKQPIGTWQDYQRKLKTAGELERDFINFSNTNIGIVTGKISNIFVLDIDGYEGEESLSKLEKKYKPLPPSVEVITGGDGRHIYFHYPKDNEVKNSAGKIGYKLDIRGNGGFVICPPSVHKSGKQYHWSVDCTEDISPAPEWLLNLVTTQPKNMEATSSADWSKLAQGVAEGSRNESIARLSGLLLRRYIDPHLVLELCLAWNESRCKPPLSNCEVTKTINSIAGIELARRTGVKNNG